MVMEDMQILEEPIELSLHTHKQLVSLPYCLYWIMAVCYFKKSNVKRGISLCTVVLP